jgi:hypothetical protein
MDGLLEGSTDQTIFVDGCDNSIRTDVDRFAGARYRALGSAAAHGHDRGAQQFKKKMRIGFGTYLASHDIPWNTENPSANQIPPQAVQDFARMGLQFGDGYLWFWTEWASWWLDGPDGAPPGGVPIRDGIKHVPEQYWRAIEDGVRDARDRKSHPNKKYYQ